LRGPSAIAELPVVTEIVIEFFRSSSARSEKILTKIDNKINNGYFYATSSTVQKIGRVEDDF